MNVRQWKDQVSRFLSHPGNAFAVSLALCAVVTRVLFDFDVSSHPALNILLPKMDGFLNDLMARNLLQPHPLRIRTPGYPLFIHYLKTLYAVFGVRPLPVYLFQTVLSLAAAVLLALTAVELFGLGAGLVTGLFYAFYKMNFLYDVMRIETSLSQVLIVAALFFFVRNRSRASLKYLWGYAFSGVLLCLLRPFLWFLFIPGLLYFFVKERHWRRAPRLAGDLVLGVLAVFLFFHFHSSDPYSHKFGVHFYFGCHAGSDGLFKPMKGISPTAEGFAKDTILAAYKETGSAEHLNSYWIRKTLDSYRGRPRAVLGLLIKKINYLVNTYEPHNNTSVYFYEKESILGILPRVEFGVIVTWAALGILGAVLRRHRGRFLLWPLLALVLMILSVFFCSRYRMPVVPFLCLFAGYGVSMTAELVRTRRFGLLGVFFLTGALFWGWSHWPLAPFNKEKDIRHWEEREMRRIRREASVRRTLKDYARWDSLYPAQQVRLAMRLERLSLPFEFRRVYARALKVAEERNEPREVMDLMVRDATFYESYFDFRKSLQVWEKLSAFPSMAGEAREKIKELRVVGPVLNKDF